MNLRDMSKTVFSATGRVKRDSQIQKLFDMMDLEKAKKVFKSYVKDLMEDGNLYDNQREELGIVDNSIDNLIDINELKTKIINYEYAGKDFAVDYLWCPKCKKFHKMHEYMHPISGWEQLLRKYSIELFLVYAHEYIFQYRLRSAYNLEQMLMIRTLCANSYKNHNYDKNYRKTHNMQHSTDFYIPSYEFKENKNGIVWECPECGTVFETVFTENSFIKMNAEKGWSLIGLYRDESWRAYNRVSVNASIFSDKEDIVTFSKIDWVIYPNIYGNLHIEHLNSRYSFNTRTGQTYKFREINMKTRQPVDETEPRISCITYLPYSATYIDDKSAQEIANKICEKKGIPHVTVNKGKYNNSFQFLCMLNRYGEGGVDFVNKMCHLASDSCKMPTRSKTKLYKIISSTEEFSRQLTKSNIRGKKRRKMYAKNPLLFIYEPILLSMGFKDNNILLSLMEHQDVLDRFVDTTCNKIRFRQHVYNSTMNDVKNFVTDYVRIKSEAELAKKIIADEEETLFCDVAMQYATLSQRLEITDDDRKRLFSGTMREMHERFRGIIRKTSAVPFYIPYAKNELKINCRCGEYDFELAKTNMEMKDVGDEMHICVGTYDNSAARKECSIVFMRKNGKIQACIELRDNGKRLAQAKDFCNHTISQEKREALKTFIKRNKIQVNDCWDYERAELDLCEGNEEYQKNKSKVGYMVFDSKDKCKIVSMKKSESISSLGLEIKPEYEVGMRIANNNFDDGFMHIPDGFDDDLPFY